MFEKRAPQKPGSGGFDEPNPDEPTDFSIASGTMFARHEQQTFQPAPVPLVLAPVMAQVPVPLPEAFLFHVEIHSYTDYDFAIGSIYQRVTDLGNFTSLDKVDISAAIKALQTYTIPTGLEPWVQNTLNVVDDVFQVDITLVAQPPHIGADLVG